MQFCRWRIEPSDFQTWRSTGSPELSIVRAVDMCIERAISEVKGKGKESLRINRIELVVEDAGSIRQRDTRQVVDETPCKLDGVKFLVAIGDF